MSAPNNAKAQDVLTSGANALTEAAQSVNGNEHGACVIIARDPFYYTHCEYLSRQDCERLAGEQIVRAREIGARIEEDADGDYDELSRLNFLAASFEFYSEGKYVCELLKNSKIIRKVE